MKFRHFILLIYLCSPSLIIAQNVKMIRFDDLEKIIQQNDDTLRVVNFWATWCAPCVKELPHFEKITASKDAAKIKILLVSMDSPSTFQTKVIPFVQKRRLKSEVVLLNEPELESWVDKLVPQWSGALPMTLFYHHKTGLRQMEERELNETELFSLINQYKLK